MAKLYIGVNNQPKEVKNWYIGINNQPKKVKKAWIGVDGKAKLFYASSRVPDGYQEVEYIYGGQRAYINPNISGSSALRIVLDIEPDYNTVCRFGSYIMNNNGGTSSQYSEYRFELRKEYIRIFFGLHGPQVNSDPIIVIDNLGESIFARHIWDLNNNGNFYFDNTLLGSSSKILKETESIQLPPIYLFKVPEVAVNSKMKIYSFKAYENSILIREMYPCYNKSNNEIGMYDVINNIFYGNESEYDNFEAGPIV